MNGVRVEISYSLLSFHRVLDIDACSLEKCWLYAVDEDAYPVESLVLWKRPSNKPRLYDVEFISLLSCTKITSADKMPRHYFENLAWILSVES